MDDLLGLWTGPNYLANHGSGLHQLQVDVLSLSLSPHNAFAACDA